MYSFGALGEQRGTDDILRSKGQKSRSRRVLFGFSYANIYRWVKNWKV